MTDLYAALELQNEALLVVLPEGHELRGKLQAMQNKLQAAELVRRYLAQEPPRKAGGDWLKLLAPAVTLLIVIIATLLGIDWKGVLP